MSATPTDTAPATTPPGAPDPAPGPGRAEVHRERLLMLTCGLRIAHVVAALAELEVAEALADGPRSVADLAHRCAADPDALYRVLRVAASVGVFTEVSPGVFDRTPLSDPIAPGAPYSLRPLIDYSTKDFVAGPYAALADSVRTGRPTTTAVLGTDFWGHLRQHPDDGDFFDRMMTGLGRWETDRHLEAITPERFATIADLGGGRGHFLGAALQRAPRSTGILVDHTDVLDTADAVLEEHGVGDRVTRLPVDVFADPLPAADAYLLKAVLHNWPDAQVVDLLTRVRSTIGTRGCPLFVIEQVVSEGNDFDHGKFLDVDMLVLFGGRERTWSQWRTLFAATGFHLAGEPDTGRWTVLTAEPV